MTGWEQVLKDAQAAGKPVILSDRRIDGFEDLYVTFVGADFVEEGRKAGTEMCKLLEGSEKKNVWELVGNVGSAPAIDRGNGFRETADYLSGRDGGCFPGHAGWNPQCHC